MTKIMLVQGRSVINSFGGAEKVFCNLANALLERGYEVTCVCDEYKKGNPVYPLKDKVKLINISAKTDDPLQNLQTRIKRLIPASFRFSRVIENEKPDLIICFFIKDVYRIKYLHKLDIPIIVMQHCYPDFYFEKMKKQNYLLNLFLLRNVAAVQVLLPSYVQQIKSRLPDANVIVIPNSVPVSADVDVVDLSNEKKTIVFVARLEENQKRPHLLLEAFGHIAKDFPDWKLELWGAQTTSAYQHSLEEIVSRYGIENQVSFMGVTKEINKVYKSADIFALPSSFEGFPLSLTEAMSIGLPPIGFKSAPAVNELIKNGENGLLADESIEDYARCLQELISSKEKRVALGKQAHEDMKAYAPEKVWDMWDEAIKKILLEQSK